MTSKSTWISFERLGTEVPSHHAGKIRAQQIAAYQVLLPYGIIASAINAAAIFLYFASMNQSPVVWAWGALLLALSLLGARSGVKAMNKKKTRYELSERALRRPVRASIILGAGWALAPILLLPIADTWQSAVLLTVCIGMMAGGAFTLSAIPRASISFVLILALGTFAGLARGGMSLTELIYATFMISYTVIMVCSIQWIFGNYVNTWLQQFQLAERATEMKRQNDVISLLLKDFQESASDYLWEIDAEGCVQNATEGLAELCQVPVDKLNGTPLNKLLENSIRSSSGEFDIVQKCIRNQRSFANVLVPVQISGEQRWWNISGKPVTEAGQYRGLRGVISDVTEARNAESRIAYLAHYDSLTDLPNRANFNDIIERCLYRQKTHDEAFSVIFVDIDHFKTINDEHGHDVGDELLRLVSRMMKAAVGENDIVARIGGDEFAIVCKSQGSKRSIMALCDRIVEAMQEPFLINDMSIPVSVSLGVSLCPENADNMIALLKCADLALYRAKEDGRGCARFFEPSMDLEARERRKLEQELRTAFAEGQFTLHYQPLVDTTTQEVRSFETLLRWDHPERGQVSPEAFINLTEQTGMIVGIGEWVIRTAMAEAATWDTDARISINLSPIQVRHRGLISVVTQALATSGIDPARIEFEITESVLLDESDESINCLHKLRALGVHIALDDFGTGYSSLSYLRAFPFDRIKIDKSFVQAMENSNECRAIVRAVAGLAKSLGMHSTAEGVETLEQVKELTSDGCTELQGFYFSHPKSAEDLMQEGVVTRRAPPEADPAESRCLQTGKAVQTA